MQIDGQKETKLMISLIEPTYNTNLWVSPVHLFIRIAQEGNMIKMVLVERFHKLKIAAFSLEY